MKITYLIALIVVLIFGLQMAGIISDSNAFMPATVLSKPHTIISSMFMHGSAQHLLLNLFGLLVFGLLVETAIGWKKWLMVYFTAGIMGNLGYLLLTGSPFIPSLGASGAIYGLMGAAAMLKPRQIIFTQFGPIPMWFAAIGWGFIEFISIFRIDNIAHSAHLFGLVGGIVIAYSHKKNARDYIYSIILIVPIVAILLFSTGFSTEIRGYQNSIDGCTLLSKSEKINLKYYLYECEESLIMGITKPSVGEPNPSYYDSYFKEILTEIVGEDCEISAKLDIVNKTVIMEGTVCNSEFLATAQNCEKERFEFFQIYETKIPIENPDCSLLN